MKAFIYTVLLTLILSGCQDTTVINEKLQLAEELMIIKPDSSLKLLKEVDPIDLSSNRLRARHALLYSQALDKNCIDLKTDTIIAPAVKYYANHGTNRDKALTNYYLGRIRHNAGDVCKAAELMQAAEKYAIPAKETYLLGLIYNCRGNLYYSQYSLTDAIKMYDLADSCFLRESKIVFSGYMHQAKAKTYALLRNYSNSQKEYNKALAIFDSVKNHRQVCLISSSLAYQMKESGKITIDSIKYFLRKTYSRYTKGMVPAIDYPIWAGLYLKENKLDSAKYFGYLSIKTGTRTKNQQCGILATICQIETADKNYKAACLNWEKAYSLLDSISRYEKEHLIQRAEERYNNKELQHRNELLRMRTRYLIYIGVLVFVILLSVFLLILKRRLQIIRAQAEENRRYQSFIEELTHSYNTLQTNYDQIKREVALHTEEENRMMDSVERRLKHIRELLKISYTCKHAPQILYNAFKEYAINMNAEEDAFADLKYILNKRYYGIADYLKTHHRNLTLSDLNVLCMLVYNFSLDSIRMVCNHDNIDSLYSRRNKLRHKIGAPIHTSLEEELQNILDHLKNETQKQDSTPYSQTTE